MRLPLKRVPVCLIAEADDGRATAIGLKKCEIKLLGPVGLAALLALFSSRDIY